MSEPGPAQNLPPLRDVIRRHGLGALKQLGQNFLLDLNLTARIARSAGDLAHCTVYEVGPGPGGLTRALLAQGAARVVAVERDRRCIEALNELSLAYPGRLQVIEGDALAIDEASLLGSGPARIVANLPYNVGTALLLKWLQEPRRFESYTLMFQKEVALRLVAPPGGKDYGRLSVLAQWLCETRRLFDIPPRAFTPPPKVTSSLVSLTPLPQPRFPAERAILERVVAAAFGQRRKMLRAALRTYAADAEVVLGVAGIAPTARAEELTIEEFCRLAEAFRWT